MSIFVVYFFRKLLIDKIIIGGKSGVPGAFSCLPTSVVDKSMASRETSGNALFTKVYRSNPADFVYSTASVRQASMCWVLLCGSRWLVCSGLAASVRLSGMTRFLTHRRVGQAAHERSFTQICNPETRVQPLCALSASTFPSGRSSREGQGKPASARSPR